MKPSTPANKRKSVSGDSIKLSSKKRKSFDSNEFDAKSNGIEESPITPTPVKKIKMFGGTSQLNSSLEEQQKAPKSPQSKKKLFKSPDVSNKKTELSESPFDASKAKNKNKGANENTNKAVEPDNGTDVSPKKNKKQKKQKVTKEVISEFAGKSKKSRNNFFLKLKERSQRDGKAALAGIESKISDIQNRNELSKTAKRKLNLLKKMKRFIESGGIEAAKNVAKNKSQDSNQKQVKKQKNKKQKKQNPQQKSVDKPKQVKKDTQEDSSSEEASNEDVVSDSEEGVVTGKMLQGNADQAMGDSDDELGEEENDSEEEEDEAEAEGDKAEAESDESEPEEDNDSDVDGAEKKPSTIVSKKNQKGAKKVNQEKTSRKENSISSSKTTDSKHRYVLHVTNLPFDATEAEISAHFQKAGKVVSVRIPKGKDNRSRGFAYVELNNEEDYEKAFSMHHTFIKGRQIKVQYTKPGNKNSEQAKKEIKVKNAKLHAMRKEGKLAGSIKQSQKRSFRRKKKASYNSAGAGDA